MEDSSFYVYVILDPRCPGSYSYSSFTFSFKPFYVGKGKNQRCYVHIKQRTLDKSSYPVHNKIKSILSENLNPVIVKVKTDITEASAFKLEKELIAAIGRFNLGLGPLANLTDGGDGLRNHKRPTLTEEHKLRISKSLKGKPKSQQHKSKMSQNRKGMIGRMLNKTHTPEALEKMRQNSSLRKGKTFEEFYGIDKAESIKAKMKQRPRIFGRTLSQEIKKRFSENAKRCTGEKAKNAKSWVFTSPTKEQFLIKGGFDDFCIQNKLSISSMRRVAYKKQKTHNGWKVSLHE